MDLSDQEFNRLLQQLQASLLRTQQPDVPYGSVAQNIGSSTEFHRQPGGRADIQTPLMSATPPQFSAMQPILMAPWLQGADEEDERRRKLFLE